MSKRTNGTKPVGISFPKQGKTEQSHKDEADINKIWAKAMRGISSDYINQYEGRYGDTTSLDFFEANIIVANAQQMFDDLPSEIRNKFENKPGLFLDFVQNPDNKDELIKMKLAKPEEGKPVPPGKPSIPEPPVTPTPTKAEEPKTPATPLKAEPPPTPAKL